MKSIFKIFWDPNPFLQDLGLLVARLTVGIGMLLHGWGKIQNFSAMASSFADPLGIGSYPSAILVIFAEFICSILLILGFMSRLALINLLITMGVAGFIHHAADPFAKKELALLYFGVYLALFFLGPGRLSVDKVIYKR